MDDAVLQPPPIVYRGDDGGDCRCNTIEVTCQSVRRCAQVGSDKIRNQSASPRAEREVLLKLSYSHSGACIQCLTTSRSCQRSSVVRSPAATPGARSFMPPAVVSNRKAVKADAVVWRHLQGLPVKAAPPAAGLRLNQPPHEVPRPMLQGLATARGSSRASA